MRVRPATWADRDACVDLFGPGDPAGWSRTFGAALQSPGARVLVAERGRAIAGAATAFVRPSVASGLTELWLDAVATRDGGALDALVRAVEREALSLGCECVVLYGVGGGRVTPAPAGDLVDRFLWAAARAATAVLGALAAGGDADVAMGADGLPTKAVDRAAEDVAVAVLAELGLPILSEEAGAIGGRTPRGGEAWIALDPLDGTRNHTRGHPPWAVSIGLVERGVARAGSVTDLASGRRWWGIPGEGAWADGRPVTPRRGGFLIVPGIAEDGVRVALPAGFDRLRMAGSTTVELCRVADGAAGGFADLDRGVVRTHDLAGPLAVLLGAGCTVLGLDGRQPVLVPDPGQVHRIVAAPTLADAEALLETAPVTAP